MGDVYFSRAKITNFLIVLFVISLGIAIYLSFYTYPACNSYECFQEKMISCDKAHYINEEPEASWKYIITGDRGGMCQVEVELLQAKRGPLELESLNGYTMTCSYPLGIVDYPEKNLDLCTGKLKEGMQKVIIQKLYTHILNNLGKLDESLESAIG